MNVPASHFVIFWSKEGILKISADFVSVPSRTTGQPFIMTYILEGFFLFHYIKCIGLLSRINACCNPLGKRLSQDSQRNT